MLLAWGLDIYLIKAIQLTCVRNKRQLFAPISFELTSGEILIIEGANGAGKSSLLRLLSGIATPASGDIHWQGHSIYHSLYHYVSELNYLGHQNGLKPGLTVNENLVLAQQLNLPESLQKESLLLTLTTKLAQFKLTPYRNTLIQHLSAGQKRRLALLKCFWLKKPLWILDEPLSSLDKETQSIFLTELKNHLEKGGIAIISSHHTLAFPSAKKLELQVC